MSADRALKPLMVFASVFAMTFCVQANAVTEENMFERIGAQIILAELSPPRNAATKDTSVIVDEAGNQTKLVAVRELPNGMRGGAVEITTGRSVMAMEYGFVCASEEYTYLGMIHGGKPGMLDDATVAKLQGYGDSIIGDNLRGVTLTPLSDDPIDQGIRNLMVMTCR